jgi:hypothetical protein
LNPMRVASGLVLVVLGCTLSGCVSSSPPQASASSGGPSAVPSPKPVPLPVYPSCPGKPQPDIWSKPDAYWSQHVYTSAFSLGPGHPQVHTTMQYSDGHSSVCDYFTSGIRSTFTDQVPDPCEWTAAHGNFPDRGQYAAPQPLTQSHLPITVLPYSIELNVIASGYRGPGTYTVVPDSPYYTSVRYRGAGGDSSASKAAFTLTVRPDGSGSVSFSGPGSYWPAGTNGPVDTTISGLLTWTCDDPPWPIITPTSVDGSGDYYGYLPTVAPLDRGALDFGNQRLRTESNAQEVTVTNSGLGPMWIHVVWTLAEYRVDKSIPRIADVVGYSVDGSDCTHAPLAVNATCRIAVKFTPTTLGPAVGFFNIWYNAGADPLPSRSHALNQFLGGSMQISLDGTGTTTDLPPLTVAPQETSINANGACRSLGVIPEAGGWQAVDNSRVVQELRGQVVQGHVTTEDFNANHNSIDYNWFVYPDRTFRKLLANPANHVTGDVLERGRIEVEWEKALLPDFPGGIPTWAGPTQGDRVYVVGNWVADCGHGLTSGYRTEIHPPQVLVTYRNAALAPFNQSGPRRGVSYDGEWATRADIFASNYGGLAIRSEGLGTDKVDIHSSQDYSFLVLAPSMPSPDAQLMMSVQERSLPPGAVAGDVTFEKLPNGIGYRGTIHFTGAADKLREVGETVYVYWKGGPAWWKPKTHTFHITIQLIHLNDAPGGTFSAFAYANEQYASLMRGSTTPLGVAYYGEAATGDDYCGAGQGRCKVPLQDNVLTVTVVDGQALHVQVRGTAPHFISLGTAYFLGTAEVTYTGDPSGWAGDKPKDAILAMAAGAEDLEAVCSGYCFSVRFNVAPT